MTVGQGLLSNTQQLELGFRGHTAGQGHATEFHGDRHSAEFAESFDILAQVFREDKSRAVAGLEAQNGRAYVRENLL